MMLFFFFSPAHVDSLARWDQWQQFTDVTQNPPAQAGTGTTETTEATEATGFGEQPLMWTNYRI